MPLTAHDFATGLASAYRALDLAQRIDLPAMIEALDAASALSAVIVPTLYRDKPGVLQEDRAVLEALRPAWELGRKMAEGKTGA